MTLKTDYKDYQFQEGETLRKYQQISNDDGTISLRDVTSYRQEGNRFSASDINSTNAKVNGLDQDVSGLQTDVNTLKSNTSTLQTSVSNINTRLNGLTFVTLTQSEYDALATKDNNTIYFITEG